MLFYHRNPDEGLLPDLLIGQQGLEEYRDEIVNDLRNRTFGGLLGGAGFERRARARGNTRPHPSRRGTSPPEGRPPPPPARRHPHRPDRHARGVAGRAAGRSGTPRRTTWKPAREATLAWWAGFWDRSWIVIDPEQPDPGEQGRGARPATTSSSAINSAATRSASTRRSSTAAISPTTPTWWQESRHLSARLARLGRRRVHRPEPAPRSTGRCSRPATSMRSFRSSSSTARPCPAPGRGSGSTSATTAPSTASTPRCPGMALGAGWGWEKGDRAARRGDPLRRSPGRRHPGLQRRSWKKGVMANRGDLLPLGVPARARLHDARVPPLHRRGHPASTCPSSRTRWSSSTSTTACARRLRSRAAELDDDGRLVIYPSTSCESYRGATNPADVIAGLQACLEGILELDDEDLQLRDKAYYRAFLERIPAFTYRRGRGRPRHPARRSLEELPERRVPAVLSAVSLQPLRPARPRSRAAAGLPRHLEARDASQEHGHQLAPGRHLLRPHGHDRTRPPTTTCASSTTARAASPPSGGRATTGCPTTTGAAAA